ncbi:putative WRKY transcription factor 27 [Gossypium australe]|uniref:Putative WRKY transcription factor 27 n=1 Tax=Gossypium australe TaxID=47621 RepID=A0A5B6W4G0_9ROSI|nr:putative WRKY transcription factor 27 [Gossypium australe]
MAAGDWDLYAVVRSCTSATNTSTPAVSGNYFSNGNNDSWREDPLACLASLTFEEEDDPFTFPNLKKSGSLQDSYEPLLSDPTTTFISTNRGTDPSSSRSINGVSSGQHHQWQQQFIKPLNTQQQLKKPRKRKNQQKRTVCHITADNLSSDPWAWRKYGQKPIKGSPYPRNYYRCSSSKGCSARKQVERSNLEPNVFIVTYTGDHTHPRPTHRNSLAGSTRNKLSTVQRAAAPATASCSTSPTTVSAPEGTAAYVNNSAGHNGDEDDESADKIAPEMSPEAVNDDEDDLLIPDVHVDDDLFKGLEELVGDAGGGSSSSTGSGLGNSSAFGDKFSSWGTGSSASAAAGGGW